MLVLTRHLKTFQHAGERISMFVGGQQIAELTFAEAEGKRVSVAIEAEQHVRIVRTELLAKDAAK